MIRVGYDVSFLAGLRLNTEKITGVGRVVTEVLSQLALDDRTQLSVTGFYRGSRLEDELAAEDLCTHLDLGCPMEFRRVYGDRFGLRSLLAGPLLKVDEQEILRRQGKATPPNTLGKLRRRALRSLAEMNRGGGLATAEFDVYHSTWHPLPPSATTGSTRRVVTIYDILPLRLQSGPNDPAPDFWQDLVNSIEPSDVVVAISEYTKRDLCDYARLDPDQVIVSPLAAESHFVPESNSSRIEAARVKYGIPPGEYLLSVANPQPRKNIPHLIRSYSRWVRDSHNDGVNLVLVGSSKLGWGTGEILSAIKQDPSLENRIHLAGHVLDEDLPALYSGSLAFLFPSLGEGFGLPVLEAMSCGTAVICSNTTSLPEITGHSALTIDPTDEDELCAAIDTMVTSEQARQRFQSEGLKRAASFNWSHTANQVIAAYERAMALG